MAHEQQILEKYPVALKACVNLISKVETLALIRSEVGYMTSVEKTSADECLLIENHSHQALII